MIVRAAGSLCFVVVMLAGMSVAAAQSDLYGPRGAPDAGQPKPQRAADPKADCVKSGGKWNNATKTCARR